LETKALSEIKNLIKQIRSLIKLGITNERRVELSKGVRVIEISRLDGVYHFTLESSGKTYVAGIELDSGSYICSCEDFKKRGLFCKHLIAGFAKLNADDRKIYISALQRRIDGDA